MICNRPPHPHGTGDAKLGYQALSVFEANGDEVSLLAPHPKHPAAALAGAFFGVARGWPAQIGMTYDRTLAKTAADLSSRKDFDLAVAIHARSALHIPSNLRQRSLAMIIDSYGQSYRTYAPHVDWLHRPIYEFEGSRMDRFERWIVTEFGQTAVVARADSDHLEKQAGHGTILQLPYAVDLDYFAQTVRSSHHAAPVAVMVGRLNYAPNLTAAQVIVDQIAPRIRRRWPGGRVIIAGARPPWSLVVRAARAGVELHADVADVRTILSQATAAIIPVAFGGGVQTKFLEAMAAKVPVIASAFANRGVVATPERDFLEAAEPQSYVTQLERLVSQPHLAGTLADNGRRFVELHNSPQAFSSRLTAAYCAFPQR